MSGPETTAEELIRWLRPFLTLTTVEPLLRTKLDAIEAEARAAAVAPLEKALREVAAFQPAVAEMFRATGTVFDKWPVSNPAGAWTAKRLAALDPEVRWQGLAFTLYANICQISSVAERAIEELSAPSPVREPEGLDVERLRKALNRQPEETPEPIGRVRRKWWRLGWLSAMAVAHEALPKATPERPADEVDG